MGRLEAVGEVISILQQCRKEKKSAAYAKCLHAHVFNNGLESHRDVGNYVVPMLVDCGSLPHAQQVFSRLIHRNHHAWTSLISGYTQAGDPQAALTLYHNMQLDDVCPSRFTLISLLKACTRLKDVEQGRHIHAHITHTGLETDVFVGSTLVDMYAKCGLLSLAQQAFHRLQTRNVVSWTALIAGYAEFGPSTQVLTCFEEMQQDGVSPDAVTFLCILKACGNLEAIDKGRGIHAEIVKRGFEGAPFIGNSLVDMYAKCGALSVSREVFDKLPSRDVVSWNALIAGYAEHGPGEEALKCLDQMQLEGISPNAVTFICALKACGSIQAIDKGRGIHAEIAQKGYETDIFLGNTLVDMYAKCGSLSEAQKVFDKLLAPDVVSWNALIAGYAEHGPGQEAFKCYEVMQLKGLSPDAITFVSVLKACGNVGALEKGREIHMEVTQKGFQRDIFIGSTLIDMYARCGLLSEAHGIFEKLPVQNVTTWNVMINGYGMNNEGSMALQCFEDMQRQGLTPDAVTFTCLLTACSRSGLVFKGQDYFKAIREDYGILPTIDHYTCMIDLFARSGHLHEAEKLLDAMPYPPSAETWKALLTACKTYGDAELGQRCFQQLVQMNPDNGASYVLMGNIFSNAGNKDDAHRIEELRRHAGAKKTPASALIEVRNRVYEFVVGSNESKEISATLETLSSQMKEEGHLPILDVMLRPASDDEKESSLCEHAEKLALAFGILNTPKGQTLRVTKNMRMCNNCHNAIKGVSLIERREIVVRDSHCIHHFKEGLCSCKVVF